MIRLNVKFILALLIPLAAIPALAHPKKLNRSHSTRRHSTSAPYYGSPNATNCQSYGSRSSCDSAAYWPGYDGATNQQMPAYSGNPINPYPFAN